eukprot:gene5839-61206_t
MAVGGNGKAEAGAATGAASPVAPAEGAAGGSAATAHARCANNRAVRAPRSWRQGPARGAAVRTSFAQQRAGRVPLDLDDIDVFLRAMETGDFGAEARHHASKRPSPLTEGVRPAGGAGLSKGAAPSQELLTPAGVLDKIIRPARGDGKKGQPRVHIAPLPDGQPPPEPPDPEQLRQIRLLSRRNLQLNNALVAKLDTIVDLCEEMERDLAERLTRERKLAEANEMMQGLLNSLLQHKRSGAAAGRRAADRQWRRSVEADDQLLQQRDEMRSLQRQVMLMDRQAAEEDAKIAVLRRELARVDPADRAGGCSWGWGSKL